MRSLVAHRFLLHPTRSLGERPFAPVPVLRQTSCLRASLARTNGRFERQGPNPQAVFSLRSGPHQPGAS